MSFNGAAVEIPEQAVERMKKMTQKQREKRAKSESKLGNLLLGCFKTSDGISPEDFSCERVSTYLIGNGLENYTGLLKTEEHTDHRTATFIVGSEYWSPAAISSLLANTRASWRRRKAYIHTSVCTNQDRLFFS